MDTFHEWDADGKHFRAVYDNDYQTRGSYAYDTEEETRAAEDEEIAALESGRYIVIGIIVTEPCGSAQHCECCAGRHETDSLWGIVIEPDTRKIEAYAKEM